MATLSPADPPTTVHGLRSFIGSYKVLSRVLPDYSSLLDPLDQAVAGKDSREKILWSDELRQSFAAAQKAPSNRKTINLPNQSDTYAL